MLNHMSNDFDFHESPSLPREVFSLSLQVVPIHKVVFFRDAVHGWSSLTCPEISVETISSFEQLMNE